MCKAGVIDVVDVGGARLLSHPAIAARLHMRVEPLTRPAWYSALQ
jgi:hypothetical protein